MAVSPRSAKIGVTLLLLLALGPFFTAGLCHADKDIISLKGTVRRFSYGDNFYGIDDFD